MFKMDTARIKRLRCDVTYHIPSSEGVGKKYSIKDINDIGVDLVSLAYTTICLENVIKHSDTLEPVIITKKIKGDRASVAFNIDSSNHKITINIKDTNLSYYDKNMSNVENLKVIAECLDGYGRKLSKVYDEIIGN